MVQMLVWMLMLILMSVLILILMTMSMSRAELLILTLMLMMILMLMLSLTVIFDDADDEAYVNIDGGDDDTDVVYVDKSVDIGVDVHVS